MSVVELFTVASAAMGRGIRAAVVLPPAHAEQPGRRFPVLYALHGSHAPFDTYSKMPPLLSALERTPMIVAMFDADAASWYLDAPLPQTAHRRQGEAAAWGAAAPERSRFTTFFFDEFIPAVDRRCRTDPRRRMLTGFSMGGFGAFHYLLSRPQAFVAVSAMSGAFMPIAEPDERQRERLLPLIGPWPEAAERYRAIDLELRLRAAAARGVRLPPIHFHCGAEDPVPGLTASNRAMAALLPTLGFAATYLETPGAHDWPFWRDGSAGIMEFHARFS